MNFGEAFSLMKGGKVVKCRFTKYAIKDGMLTLYIPDEDKVSHHIVYHERKLSLSDLVPIYMRDLMSEDWEEDK